MKIATHKPEMNNDKSSPGVGKKQLKSFEDHRSQTESQTQLKSIFNSKNKIETQFKKGAASNTTLQKSVKEEDEVQAKFASSQFKKEEEEIPKQGVFQLKKEEDEQPAQNKKNNTGMPDIVKQKMESSFGTDFSDVKIHSNSSKAPEVGALAYTQGTDIHFAPGQFSPDSNSGQKLIGHELAHVQQQREGRVQATTEVAGMPVNDNAGLEKEADRLGDKAAK